MSIPLREISTRLTVSILAASFFLSPLQAAFAQAPVVQSTAPASSAQAVEHAPVDIKTSAQAPAPADLTNAFELKNTKDTSNQKDKSVKPVPGDKSPLGKPPKDGPPVAVSAQSGAANKWVNSYAYEERLPEPSGSFTYEIPIITPPGRNGIQPNLKLSYNSQSKEGGGLFGLGWSINIPYIERINKNGVEKMYTQSYFRSTLDGDLATTSLTATDVYGAKFDDGSMRQYTLCPMGQQHGLYWTKTARNTLMAQRRPPPLPAPLPQTRSAGCSRRFATQTIIQCIFSTSKTMGSSIL